MITVRNFLIACSPLAFRLALYIQFGLVEGDWLNDWLTYLPFWMRLAMLRMYGY